MRRLLILLLIAAWAFAAPGEVMPEGLAQGSATVALEGADSIFGNPAALGSGDSLFFIGNQSYGINLKGSTFALSRPGVGLGARILGTANPEENNNTDLLLWAGGGESLGPLSVGFALSAFSSTAPGLRGRGGVVDLGLQGSFGQGTVGLLRRNLWAIERWQFGAFETTTRPPGFWVLGFTLKRPGLNLEIYPEAEGLSWQGGFSFRVLGVEFRVGKDGTAPTFGVALDVGPRQLEYAWRGGAVPFSYLGIKFRH